MVGKRGRSYEPAGVDTDKKKVSREAGLVTFGNSQLKMQWARPEHRSWGWWQEHF